MEEWHRFARSKLRDLKLIENTQWWVLECEDSFWVVKAKVTPTHYVIVLSDLRDVYLGTAEGALINEELNEHNPSLQGNKEGLLSTLDSFVSSHDRTAEYLVLTGQNSIEFRVGKRMQNVYRFS